MVGNSRRGRAACFIRPFGALFPTNRATNLPVIPIVSLDRRTPLGAAPVTVAIATFNRAPMLRQALESCRNQSVPPQRVIVVDDGSTDDTAQVVNGFEGLAVDYAN